ncbi:MAG: hypothetical protein ACI9CE_001855 [Flavobacterium sp.]|jgi:hypothetical protein
MEVTNNKAYMDEKDNRDLSHIPLPLVIPLWVIHLASSMIHSDQY